MGPHCRKAHGYTSIPEDVRKAANSHIHAFALLVYGNLVMPPVERTTRLQAILVYLRLLGASKVADHLEAGQTVVTVALVGAVLEVSCPYNGEFLRLTRSHPGRRWIPGRKVTEFPAAGAAALKAALKAVWGVAALMREPSGAVVTIGEWEVAAVQAEARAALAKQDPFAGTPFEAPAPAPAPKPKARVFVESTTGAFVKPSVKAAETVTILAPYNEDLVAWAKEQKGRRYVPSTKGNVFPYTQAFLIEALAALERFGFSVEVTRYPRD